MKNRLIEIKEKGLALLQSLKSKFKNKNQGKKKQKPSKKDKKIQRKANHLEEFLPISCWESKQPLTPYSS